MMTTRLTLAAVMLLPFGLGDALLSSAAPKAATVCYRGTLTPNNHSEQPYPALVILAQSPSKLTLGEMKATPPTITTLTPVAQRESQWKDSLAFRSDNQRVTLILGFNEDSTEAKGTLYHYLPSVKATESSMLASRKHACT